MALSLPASAEAFLTENHVGTLTSLRPDGSPHVAPVRFTWDGKAGLVRVMTLATRWKARNLMAGPGSRAAVCQVEGTRWITLEGPTAVSDNPQRIAEGVRRYTERYQASPPEQSELVVIEIAIDRVMRLG